MSRVFKVIFLSTILSCVSSVVLQSKANAEPFKLGVEQKNVIPGQNLKEQYPMPVALPDPYQTGGVQKQAPMRARIQKKAPPKRKPIKARIGKSVPLPPGLMGRWLVRGKLQEAQGSKPQYREALRRIFRPNTQNVWTLSGNPQKGYYFSNAKGAKSALFVNKVQGNTAFIRYGHPIGKCVAQEAVVMQLSPNGMEFKGLERVTIVKKGEQWRFKAKYQLVGVRQR